MEFSVIWQLEGSMSTHAGHKRLEVETSWVWEIGHEKRRQIMNARGIAFEKDEV